MKLIKFSFIIAAILTIASCSNKTAKGQKSGMDNYPSDSQQVSLPKTPEGGPSPAAIQVNRSEISAEVIEVTLEGDSSDFIITAKTLEVREDPAYPSIAAKNMVYKLKPNFVLGENQEITDNPRNASLMKLKKLKKGDSFEAVIFLDNSKHWMIQEVLDK